MSTLRTCVAVALPPVLLLVSSLAGCSKSDPASPVPSRIFFITVDTLRADHLGIYGYPRNTSPNLDRLAGEGVLFDRAIAQWPKTTPSFASMFTGRYPQSTGMTHRAARRLAEKYQTLAEMMQAAGYWTAAVVSNPVLSTDLGWNQGFDVFEETWQTEEDLGSDRVRFRALTSAPRVNEMARPLLRRSVDKERSFIWLHYSDPHVPYLLPPEFDNPFLGDEFDADQPVPVKLPPTIQIGEETRVGFYVAQYDANVQVADRYIGEILEVIDELEFLEDALVVFTSDHGEGLGEHDYYFRHGGVPYNTNSHVPLFIRYPGAVGGGQTVQLPVELIDLYPTLGELISAEMPTELEGKSLVPFLRGPGKRVKIDPTDFAYAYSESGQPKNRRNYYRTVQDERWKLVFHPAVDKKGRQEPVLFELYDLETDPLELSDLAGQHENQFKRLWDRLSSWMQQGENPSAEMAEGEGHSQETRDALRALGYLD